jgi:hypothetical protein
MKNRILKLFTIAGLLLSAMAGPANARLSRVWVLGVAMFLGALASGPASAGVTCGGPVSMLAFGPTTGLLHVNYGWGVHYLCKFSETHNGVHPETCKAWYAMFLAARNSGKQVRLTYDVTDQNFCSQIGSWVTPSPFPYFTDTVD